MIPNPPRLRRNGASALLILILPLLLVAGGCAGLDATAPGTGIEAGFVSHPLEVQLYDMVNQVRAQRGLSRLDMHDVLSKYARLHSQNMARGRLRFGHDGFRERASEIRVYLSVMEISENVAVNKGYDHPVKAALESFLDSRGHRDNLMGRFDLTGVGVAKSSDGRIFFTQMFADGAGRFR